MGKEKKGINPADAFRKEQRKKEVKKLKKEREVVREVRSLLNNPDKIDEEIAKVQRQSNEYKLDKSLKDRIVELKRMKEVALQKEQINARSSSSSAIPVSAPVPAAMPVGRRPDESAYYHPVYNPSGMPPPGQPELYRPPPPPPMGAGTGVQLPYGHPPPPRMMMMPYGPPRGPMLVGGCNGVPLPPPRPALAPYPMPMASVGMPVGHRPPPPRGSAGAGAGGGRKRDRDEGDPLDPAGAGYADSTFGRHQQYLLQQNKRKQQQQQSDMHDGEVEMVEDVAVPQVPAQEQEKEDDGDGSEDSDSDEEQDEGDEQQHPVDDEDDAVIGPCLPAFPHHAPLPLGGGEDAVLGPALPPFPVYPQAHPQPLPMPQAPSAAVPSSSSSSQGAGQQAVSSLFADYGDDSEEEDKDAEAGQKEEQEVYDPARPPIGASSLLSFPALPDYATYAASMMTTSSGSITVPAPAPASTPEVLLQEEEPQPQRRPLSRVMAADASLTALVPNAVRMKQRGAPSAKQHVPRPPPSAPPVSAAPPVGTAGQAVVTSTDLAYMQFLAEIDALT